MTDEQQRELAVELIRNTPEYKAAWELELWKKREKTVYKKQLEEKEKQHLKNVEAKLREEFSKYEKQILEQKEILKSKEQQYNQVLEEMNAREKQLVGVELELRRRKTELETDYQRKIEHMEHVIKMEKESFQQRLQLETIKNQELQKRIDQQLSHDVMELNERITKLQVENESLESKLHQATNSKQNYKIQWKKVSEELIRTKKKQESELRKLQQKIIALQTLQTSPLTPSQPPPMNPFYPHPNMPQNYQYPNQMNPHSPFYPYPPMQSPFDPNNMQQNPQNFIPPNQQQQKQDADEIGSLKKMLADLIKKETEDKKEDSKLNTSTSSSGSTSSTSSGESNRKGSKRTSPSSSPPTVKTANSTTKKTSPPRQQQTKQEVFAYPSPHLDNSRYEEEPSLNETQNDISVEAHNFANHDQNENDERSREFKRLLREKSRLLKSGIYDSKSDIILEIEKKLQSL
ncbi:predicted protein [Naegleria gruberi]|uniref:Predicted protein n=1 Tax=Naegleria gruberi TaxID=5762 RepID=D2VAS5_NAEGR|nr:uncharacterized protein NAEGRDRAFT_48030 [Naegleria gruberi]EFC46000.1 predicted protein [Naegleria gruberi]|eukprot:XP_002678744.1 predicted protein [Naegleria gruberi strain NEG-M]